MAIEVAMDLCIDENDEERESEAQSAVRVKARAGGLRVGGGARAFALTAESRKTACSSSVVYHQAGGDGCVRKRR